MGLPRGLEGPRGTWQRPWEEGRLVTALRLDVSYTLCPPKSLAWRWAWLLSLLVTLT